MNGIVWSTGFQNLTTSQLPHDHRGHLLKNTAEYLLGPNEPEFGGQQAGVSAIGTSVLTSVPVILIHSQVWEPLLWTAAS